MSELLELVIKCPHCAREVRTGCCTTEEGFQTSEYSSNYVHCGGCRCLLQWDKADAVLKPREVL